MLSRFIIELTVNLQETRVPNLLVTPPRMGAFPIVPSPLVTSNLAASQHPNVLLATTNPGTLTVPA